MAAANSKSYDKAGAAPVEVLTLRQECAFRVCLAIWGSPYAESLLTDEKASALVTKRSLEFTDHFLKVSA
jgi:hypothetical protein